MITDLVMPGLDGVELTRRIRLELPKTKIILMSSYIEDAYRLMASDSGADAFVSKQMITRTLLPAIGDAVRREAEPWQETQMASFDKCCCVDGPIT